MAEKAFKNDGLEKLPAPAADYVRLVIRKMRYRKKVRADVMAELAGHFEDELRNCRSDEEKNQKAQQVIAEFGDPQLLAVLMRRAKKRCQPLWQKLLIRTAKVIGLIVLYVIVRIIYLTAGTPTISVNYIDWLNEKVAVKTPGAENAKADYDRAAELVVTMPQEVMDKQRALDIRQRGDIKNWFADFNDNEMKVLEDWLAANKESLDALRQGSQKHYYWPTYKDPNNGYLIGSPAEAMKSLSQYRQMVGVTGITMKLLPKYRQAAVAMRWQIVYDTWNGRISDAINDCIALQRFSRHMEGKGLLTEQLVGMAVEGLARALSLLLLEKVEIPPDVLRSFFAAMKTDIMNTGPILKLNEEKVLWYDLIQRGFTDDGRGNGRVLKEGLPLVVKDGPSAAADFFLWNYPDRREVTAMIDEYFAKTEQLLEKTPHQTYQHDRFSEWDELGKEGVMLKIMTASYKQTDQVISRCRTGRATLLATTAVLLYKKEKGGYPETLDELVSGWYLDTLPLDPYSDKPLVYKKTDEGFLLYSVGSNFTDDGGEVIRYTQGERKGQVKEFADEGDWVFWPRPE